jgi:hypothetical protein
MILKSVWRNLKDKRVVDMQAIKVAGERIIEIKCE